MLSQWYDSQLTIFQIPRLLRGSMGRSSVTSTPLHTNDNVSIQADLDVLKYLNKLHCVFHIYSSLFGLGHIPYLSRGR